MNNKITIDFLIQKSKEYYAIADNTVGGNLHIVLDDGNINDSDIEFCLDLCNKDNDVLGIEMCELLLSTSKTQRKKLVSRYNEYAQREGV